MQIKITSDVHQSDNRKSVQAQYTTSINDTINKNYLINSEINSSEYATSQIENILAELKRAEVNALELAINNGGHSISDIVANLKYLTVSESLYLVVERGVSLSSVYRLINLKSVAEYTKVNFTNIELSSISGFSIELVELYYSRIATALTCVDALNILEGNLTYE